MHSLKHDMERKVKWCHFVWLALLIATTLGAEVVPVSLQCEYRENPLGISAPQPHFSWQLASAERGIHQTAYRLQITSEATKGVLWDSDKVNSGEQNGISYRGPSLAGKSAYVWRVKVWDQDGRESSWSKDAAFETGIVNPQTDWVNNWVGGPPVKGDSESISPNSQFNLIRRRFDLPAGKRVQRARAYVAAQQFPLSFFVFHVNGQAPGNLFPLRRGVYTLDVTDLLKPGENIFGASFGNPGNAQHDANPQRLLCDLEIWFTDGSHQTVGTDARCRGSTGGPVLSADMYDGENYDARLETAWDQPGFDDSGWKPCLIADTAERPKDSVLNLVRVFETIAPVKLTEPRSGTFILDAGTQMSGWLQLWVKGKAGDRLRLRFAERLYPDGTLDMSTVTNGLPAQQTDSYILKGGQEEAWEPNLTYHGFRYVEIVGWPGTPSLDNFQLRRLAADVLSRTAGFACSDPDLNRLYRAFYETELDNLMFEHTTCNQRAERSPWSADVMCIAEAAMTYFDLAQFFQEKWLDQCLYRTGPHGEAGNLVYETGGYALIWQSQCASVSWDYWQAYGDTAYLAPCYERVKKFTDCCSNWFDQLDSVVYDPTQKRVVSHSSKNDFLIDAETPWRDPDGKPCDNLLKYWGDWLRPDRNWTKNASFLTSAYYFHCADVAARMAAALGKTEDAAHYRQLANEIRAAINDRWLKQNRFYCDNDQTVNAVSLAFNIVPDSARTSVVESLAKDIEARTNHLATGCIGTLALIPALAENGREDLVLALARQHTYPSWQYMLDVGPGTFWEHWNDEAMSKCHMFMGGSISAWLFRDVAGIKPVAPGYAELELRPGLLNGLAYTKATVPTIRGLVTSDWRWESDDFFWNITVPPNSAATVYLPAKSVESVEESGQPAAKSPHVKFLRMEKDFAVFAVGSGSYQFISRQCPARSKELSFGSVNN